MEIIDDPPREVAYLRLSAHLVDKETSDLSKIPVRPIFDDKFQEIYDTVKQLQKVLEENCSDGDIWDEPIPPQIRPIGDDVFATNTVIPHIDLPVEQALVHCFDSLSSISRSFVSNASSS